MKSDYIPNPNYALDLAKQVTLAAIQNNLIAPSTDSDKTADYVADFYSEFVNKITTPDSDM